MRLLHVISGMDPKLGGVSQAVRTIIVGLEAEGVHNEVASLDAPDADWGQPDAFPIHALGPGKGPWNHSDKLIPWLVANFARFDVVIVHGLWLYHGYALRKALRQFKARLAAGSTQSPKYFVMPHGMLDPYFQRVAGRKLKALRNRLYWAIIEKHVVNDADGLLFTCQTERELAREPFAPYRPQRELVVGLGVEEPPAYTPAMREAFLAKCPELGTRPYLLFLSRINEKKGVDLLLNAYAAVAGPTTNKEAEYSAKAYFPAQLVVAGPGLETSYGDQMQRLTTETPALQTQVTFPGMLTGDAKWGAFYGCEAFVLPSHQENFGIAVVEALACGKPVLISNQVNIWQEIVAAGGGLVADDTLQGTQQLLKKWESSLTEHGYNASQRARYAYQEHFAVPTAAKKMLSALA
jgi:glycosyltransferase involved in cell wall biosynthesis